MATRVETEQELRARVAARLRLLRLEHSFTQQQIADYIGVERSAYTHCECADVGISIYNLIKLARLYCVDMDFFISKAEPVIPDYFNDGSREHP